MVRNITDMSFVIHNYFTCLGGSDEPRLLVMKEEEENDLKGSIAIAEVYM